MFDTTYMVTIKKMAPTTFDITQMRPQTVNEDWENIIDQNYKCVDRESLHVYSYPQRKILKLGNEIYWDMALRNVPRLRQDVTQWLHDNVPLSRNKEQYFAWCVGNDDYNLSDRTSFSIWFERKRDAMRFIQTWSKHKKPLEYYDGFNSRKHVLQDGKLVEVEYP